MALIIARNADGSSPVRTGGVGTALTKSVTLDGSGGTEDTAPKTFYLFADGARFYDGIQLSFVNEETGINYQLSLLNAPYTWENSITPSDIDALLGDESVAFYVRAEVTNDGGVNQPATGTYTGANLRLEATEHDSDPSDT